MAFTRDGTNTPAIVVWRKKTQTIFCVYLYYARPWDNPMLYAT